MFRDPTGHVEVIANIRGHAVTDVETASGSQADTGGGHTNANWSIDVACRCSESGFKAHFTIRVDADVYYYSGPYPYEGRIPNDPSVEDADSARAHEERVHVFGPAQYMKTLLEPWEAESYASPGLCQLYADMAISTAMLAVSYATAEY